MPPPIRKISHSSSAGTLPTFTQLTVSGDGHLLVPPPVRLPPTHQGHARITHGNGTHRVWVEVRGAGVHVYPNEAAAIPSLVVTPLDQCLVTRDATKVALQREGREQLSLYLDTEEEAEHWAEMLKVTSVHRSLSFEGLNLECGVAAVVGVEDSSSDSSELGEDVHGCSGSSVADEDDHPQSGDNTPENSPGGKRRQPRLRGVHNDSRKELLQHMLATKSLLEKKQKHRRSGVGAWAMTAGEVVNEYDRAQHEAQQDAMRKAVLLRQRKNSTAIKMSSLEKGASLGKRESSRGADRKPREVGKEMEVLRKRLSSLDSQLQEDDKNMQKTLLDIEERRNHDLDIIKDLGGDNMDNDLNRQSLCEDSAASQRGSVASIPSIVINSSEKSEKKTPEKIFGFRVGGRDRKLKPRNPLNFLDIKLKVHRRHKSTENLSTRKHEEELSHRSQPNTPGNLSTRSNSSNSNHNSDVSDEETEPTNRPQISKPILIDTSVRTEINPEALAEIEAFKDLISRYFSNHPRHDSITNRDYSRETNGFTKSHSQEIIL